MLIYLTGYMGSGKTTAGLKLAVKMGYAFADLDVMIENKFKITISQFFSKYGEPAFRKVEREVLIETFSYNNTVIATGGGTPCYTDNMELINQHGVSVYIKIPEKALFQRLFNSKKKRPLLLGKTDEEILEYIRYQMTIREPFYLKSCLTAEGIDINITGLAESISNYVHPVS
jgi:shikimate kinase